MKRQTRLTPAEGGRFAGPVGSPVPPNDADRGRASDAQVEAANNTLRRLDKKLVEHGCEMLQRDNMFQWVVIKGDKVLMRIPRAKLELASLEETAALVEEVLTRDAASREDMLEMLDDARNSERLVQADLDRTMTERDCLSGVLDALRTELARTRAAYAAALDARDQARAMLADERKERKCSEHGCQRKAVTPSTPDPPDFVLNARRARAAFAAEQEPIDYRMVPPVGFVSTRVMQRPSVGSLSSIMGDDDGLPHGQPGVVSFDEIAKDADLYGSPGDADWNPTYDGGPHAHAALLDDVAREVKEAVSRGVVAVIPAGRHLLEAGQNFVVEGGVCGPTLSASCRGIWDVWVRDGVSFAFLIERKEG